jgi:hypothetical protein
MAADPLRCPACSGALSNPGATRCEWCGATLPVAPTAPAPAALREGERDRLAAVLEKMQARPAVSTRPHGVGCALFLLLVVAVLFVFFVTMTPRTTEPSAATPDPPAAHPKPIDANGPHPAATDGR